MSYILDSIKKSDQERSDITIDTPDQLKTPAYLEASAPKKDISLWLYIVLGLIVTCIGLMFVFFIFFKNQKPIDSLVKTPIAIESTPIPADVASTPANAIPTISNEEQKNTIVDSLYESREQKKNVMSSAVVSEKTESATINTPVVTKDLPVLKNDVVDVVIPSVFSLNATAQRSIPAISYDAHIYASDNNSGFVILNGAKKQVGESLRSGIYIEKINQEDVVLSYNGLLFTLPALKSWSYQ